MVHTTAVVTLAGLFTLGPAPAGRETYTVRMKAAGVGDTIRVDKDETQVERFRLADAAGRVLIDRTERVGETLVYRETILDDGGAAGAARLRRQYEKALVKKGRRAVDLPYHGRAVLIERREGRYRFRIEGGRDLLRDDAGPLDREFNGGDEKFRLGSLLPGKPVPVGGTWKVDMGGLVKDFTRTGRFAVDENRVTGTGRLGKASPLGGAQFGDLIYRLEIPVQAMAFTPGSAKQAVLPGSKGAFDLTLKLCIDGTVLDGQFAATGEVKATAPMPLPSGGTGKLVYSVEVDTRESRTQVAAK